MFTRGAAAPVWPLPYRHPAAHSPSPRAGAGCLGLSHPSGGVVYRVGVQACAV